MTNKKFYIILTWAQCYKTFFGLWFKDIHSKLDCLLDYTGKACQGQTLKLIMKIGKLRTKKVL